MKEQHARIRVAQEAARIMEEEGVRDFYRAKNKAAERLGIHQRSAIPSNQEVEAELRQYLSLFKSHVQPQRLRHLRETALSAMKFFKPFQPLLVGPVLDGTAGEYATVVLHLFADSPEEVSIYLTDNDMPYEQAEMRLKINADERQPFPVYRFLAGEAPVELVVFPLHGSHRAPLSPVDGKPMQRADEKQLRALLT